MPLYKKITSKARVKTQSSFISPLLSQASTTQTKIKDLLKDDYKENLHIPTKKKLLEPLINISQDGNLLDKLQQKSFKDSRKTFVKVSKTNETYWPKNDRDGANKTNIETAPKFKDLVSQMECDNVFDKDGNGRNYCSKKSKNHSLNGARSKSESNRTLSELNAQSPLLFSSSPSSVQSSNKRFKTEKSMTITTKIEISSNTDGNICNVKRACDTPNSLRDLLNDCVTNNLRMSQQFLSPDLTDTAGVQTSIEDDKESIKRSIPISKIEESENDLDSSLRSILDDIVNTNIILSQNMKTNDDSNQTENKIGSIKSKEKKDKQALKANIQKTTSTLKNLTKKPTGKTKTMSTEENETESSLRSILDDVVNTNIILSQEMMTKDHSSKNVGNKPKKNRHNKESKKHKDPNPKIKKTMINTDLKKSSEVSKKNIRSLSKSKEIIKTPFKSTLYNQSEESIKIKSFKRVRALCSEEDDDDQLEQPIVSHKEVINKPIIMKNKATEKLKEKIKKKYLIEKKTSVKSKGKKSQNINYEKEQNQDNQENKVNILKAKGGKESKQSGDKKVERSKSSLTDNQRKGNEVGKKAIKCPPKSKNMIFTSEETNKMTLKKALELQEERDVGLYVYCDTCDRVRYLQQCKDPLELPEKWYCHMNPDTNYNRCSDSDFEIELEMEELIIFNKYNAGSIVWAKMDGYPWWPAMVDDDPNIIDYFWLDDENSKEPSWYHVTFFDSSDVTRAWIRTANLEPFKVNAKNAQFKPKNHDFYRNRLAVATKEAKAACKMEVLQRLRLYSFVVRYSKKHNQTKKKGCPMKTDVVKNTQNLVDNTDRQAEKMPRQSTINSEASQEENMDIDNFDNISLTSNEFISSILKPKKSWKKIVSEDDILENIDLNDLICSEDSLDVVV